MFVFIHFSGISKEMIFNEEIASKLKQGTDYNIIYELFTIVFKNPSSRFELLTKNQQKNS